MTDSKFISQSMSNSDNKDNNMAPIRYNSIQKYISDCKIQQIVHTSQRVKNCNDSHFHIDNELDNVKNIFITMISINMYQK